MYTTGREDSFKRVYPSTTPASFDFKQSKNTDWFIEAKRRLEVRNEVEILSTEEMIQMAS